MLFYIVQTGFPKIIPSSSKKSVFSIILQFYIQQGFSARSGPG